jgi:hypothetical protein
MYKIQILKFGKKKRKLKMSDVLVYQLVSTIFIQNSILMKTVNRPFSVYRSIFSVSSFHNSSKFDFLNFNRPVFSEPVSLVFIDI